MRQKILKRTGDKTSPAQRRINRANSLAALSRLLELNFSAGARLITLGYESAAYAPVGKYAEANIKAWVRLARAQMGGTFRYVRAMRQTRGSNPAIVHLVVTVCPEAAVGALAASWEYGPTSVTEVNAGELSALAKWLAENEAAPNCKTWISSRGLKRP